MKPGRRRHRLEALRALRTTVVCYESPHRLLAALEAIAEVFGDRPMAVAEADQAIPGDRHGTAGELRGASARRCAARSRC